MEIYQIRKMLTYGVIFSAICIFSTEADIIFRNPVSTLTTEYDTVVVVQGWPVTTYKLGETKIRPRTCLIPSENVWNLHGVWPVKRKGQSPAYCDDTATIDVESLNPSVLGRMERQWPVYTKDPDNAAFWKTQWRKHGTCATKTPSLRGVGNYFAGSMDLLDKYNVAPILNTENIQPGGSYEPRMIVAAVKKYFKVEPVLTCVQLENQKDRGQHLYEILLCTDLNLDLKACSSSIKHKCNMNKSVVFTRC